MGGNGYKEFYMETTRSNCKQPRSPQSQADYLLPYPPLFSLPSIFNRRPGGLNQFQHWCEKIFIVLIHTFSIRKLFPEKTEGLNSPCEIHIPILYCTFVQLLQKHVQNVCLAFFTSDDCDRASASVIM